jgi:probable poly-beta-1,6-N-acetyl-D-glucosamine export protein
MTGVEAMAASSCAGDGEISPSAPDPREFVVFRIPWIRGVCVLGVILIHVAGIVQLRHRVDWLSPILIFLIGISRFAVPTFIVVSGFYLSLNVRNERPLPFYRRTMRPLLISYIVYSTLYVAMTFRTGHPSWRTWLWALSTGTANGTLWFIPVIVELYLLHPFLHRWYRCATSRARFVVLACLVQVASAIVAEVFGTIAQTMPWLQLLGVGLSFLQYVGYFVLGYYLLEHASDIPVVVGRRDVRAAAGVTWLAAAGALAAWNAIPLLRVGTWEAIPYPGLAVALLAVPMSAAALPLLVAWSPGARVPRLINRLVGMCGLYAFGVYYLHPVVLSVVSVVLTKFAGLSWDGVAFYALAFPLVSTLGALSVKLLARLPHTRYLA